MTRSEFIAICNQNLRRIAFLILAIMALVFTVVGRFSSFEGFVILLLAYIAFASKE